MATPTLQTLLDLNRADIAAEVSNFRTFTAGGSAHTILGRDTFYTLRVGEVPFRDWLEDLVTGAELEDVHCEDDCAQAELST